MRDVVGGVWCSVFPLEYVIITNIFAAKQFRIFAFGFLESKQDLPHFVCYGICAKAGSVFCAVFLHNLAKLHDSVFNGQSIVFKAYAVPFQPKNFASPQTVNDCEINEGIQGFIFYAFQQVADLTCRVKICIEFLYLRQDNKFTWICCDISAFYSFF